MNTPKEKQTTRANSDEFIIARSNPLIKNRSLYLSKNGIVDRNLWSDKLSDALIFSNREQAKKIADIFIGVYAVAFSLRNKTDTPFTQGNNTGAREFDM